MLKRYNYRTKLLKHSFSLIAYGNANIKFESFSGLEYKRTVKRATYPSHAGRTHTKFHVYNNFIFDTGHMLVVHNQWLLYSNRLNSCLSIQLL